MSLREWGRLKLMEGAPGGKEMEGDNEKGDHQSMRSMRIRQHGLQSKVGEAGLHRAGQLFTDQEGRGNDGCICR